MKVKLETAIAVGLIVAAAVLVMVVSKALAINNNNSFVIGAATLVALMIGYYLWFWWNQKPAKTKKRVVRRKKKLTKPPVITAATPTPKWVLPTIIALGAMLVMLAPVVVVCVIGAIGHFNPSRETLRQQEQERHQSGSYGIMPDTTPPTANPLPGPSSSAPSLTVYGDREVSIPVAYNSMLIHRADSEAVFVLRGFRGGQEVAPPWVSKPGGKEYFPAADRYTIQCTNRTQTIINFVPDR